MMLAADSISILDMSSAGAESGGENERRFSSRFKVCHLTDVADVLFV